MSKVMMFDQRWMEIWSIRETFKVSAAIYHNPKNVKKILVQNMNVKRQVVQNLASPMYLPVCIIVVWSINEPEKKLGAEIDERRPNDVTQFPFSFSPIFISPSP